MEKNEKKSFLSRFLGKSNKTKVDGKRLYNNTKQTTTKIKLALLELLQTKELSQINITNLVKVAGVYRATFYLHYRGLNNVIDDIEQDVYECYENIRAQMQDIDLYNNIDILLSKICEYVSIDKKYLNIIINTNCFNRITLKLRELLFDILISNFSKFGHISGNEPKLLDVGMYTSSVVFAFRDFINNFDIEIDNIKNKLNKLYDNLIKNN